MKRIFTLVVLLSAMAMAVQAQGVKFGVKGGLNITKMSFDKDVINSDNQTGFFVGPTVQASLPGGLGMDISALYDERSAEVEGTDVKQKGLYFPVNLRYKLGIGSKIGVYGAAGPQFGFPVGDKIYDTKFGEYRLRDANLSINLGAGVYLTKHLEVGFTYNIPVGKSGEFNAINEAGKVLGLKDDEGGKAYAWQINAAIFF